MSKFAILRSRLDKAETIRRQYEAIWKDITYYVAPNRSNFISTNSNHYASKVVPNIYNTTAIQAAEMLAATLYSGLTNDSTKWFSLKVKDLELQNVDSVKRFLEAASNKMLEIFTSPESGFSQQNHELLLDLVTYGTGCIFLEESEKDVIKFSSRHLNEIYIVEDYTGIVDTVFRKFNLTARQLKQQFGDVVDSIPLIKGALESDPDREVEIVHAIYPNSDYSDSGKAKGRFKYNSCYLMGDMETVIMEGHFYELPYLVPRWAKRVGEIYGRSPAWNAIADIKSVNTMEETMLKASQKRVNPPLLVADDGVLQPVRTYPNALIYGGLDSTNYQARIQPLNMVGDLSINESMIEKKNKSIRDIFYIDQLVF